MVRIGDSQGIVRRLSKQPKLRWVRIGKDKWRAGVSELLVFEIDEASFLHAGAFGLWVMYGEKRLAFLAERSSLKEAKQAAAEELSKMGKELVRLAEASMRLRGK